METALAALIYKVIFRSSELTRLHVYFATFYVAFLVWAIWNRNLRRAKTRVQYLASQARN